MTGTPSQGDERALVDAFPDYTIVRELGKGATARVFLAVQKSLNRRVALKVLSRSVSADPAFTQRFLREGRIIARLSHPHIVSVYDVGDHDGRLYMAMQYLAGGTLAERSDGLTVSDLGRCLDDVLSALSYAHREGFVHRDIKPDNILFDADGRSLLTDFGIARAAESLTRMTVTGAIIGTPAYMSPEQVSGAELDGRADLYSVGVVLYELLTGHTPFAGDSVMSVGLQHLTAPVPRLPDALGGLQPLIDRAMAKRRDERFEAADEFRNELAARLSGSGLPADATLDTLSDNAPPVPMDVDRALAATRHTGDAVRAGRRWLPGAVAAAALAAGAWVAAERWLVAPGDPPATDSVTTTRPEVEDAFETPAEAAFAADLRRARQALDADRWFAPADDNAVDHFRRVLEIDPGNADAEQGLATTQSRAVRRAGLLIDSGRLDEAEALVSNIDTVWPDAVATDSLAARIDERQSARQQAVARQSRAGQIDARLARATAALRRGDLTTPPDDNAFGHYRAVLELAADHPLARAGIDTVSERLVGQVERTVASNDVAAAGDWLDQLRIVAPDHPRLDALSGSIESTTARLNEERAAAQRRAAFAAKVAATRTQVEEFLTTDTLAEPADFQQLSDAIADLLAEAPNDSDVLALQASVRAHRAALEEQAPDDDRDRFNLPNF